MNSGGRPPSPHDEMSAAVSRFLEPLPSMPKTKFGQAIPRVEDRRFLVGEGCYVDDITLPGLAHGVIVYSNRSHARIKSINTTRALQASGVLAVRPNSKSFLTAKEV